MKRIVWIFLVGILVGGGLTVAGLLASGTLHREHEHSDHAEARESEPLQVTVWTLRHEVFIEHDPIAAGKPVEFVTHVTELAGGDPRREGEAVFVLRREADAPIEHREEKPARPGIYKASLTFPTPGTWTVGLKLPGADGGDVVELPPVTVHPSEGEAAGAAKASHEDGILFLKEPQWLLGLKSGPAGKRRVVERLRVHGVVAAPPGGRASAVPPVDGHLDPPPGRAYPKLGERVEAGQILARVRPPFSDFAAKIVEAEAEAARTRVALDQAEAAAVRVRKLAAGDAKSPRELEEAEFALRAARASQEGAASVKAAYARSGGALDDRGIPSFEIRAPIAGVVTSISATPGEMVHAGRPMLTILDASKVIVEGRLPESDFVRVRRDAGALVEIPGATGTKTSLLARAFFVQPEVDPATRTVALLFEFDNHEGRLLPGMSVTLQLETARAEDALVLPVGAIVEEEGRPVCFAHLAGESFEKRPLKVGLRDGEWVQILDGVREGERIVTRAAYAVRLASVAPSAPSHGHDH